MFARHVTVKGDAGRMAEVVRTQQEAVLPVLRDCVGFKAQLGLLDCATGEVIGLSLWDTKDSMEASEERVQVVRQRVADSFGAGSPADVRLYEVPIFEVRS